MMTTRPTRRLNPIETETVFHCIETSYDVPNTCYSQRIKLVTSRTYTLLAAIVFLLQLELGVIIPRNLEASCMQLVQKVAELHVV